MNSHDGELGKNLQKISEIEHRIQSQLPDYNPRACVINNKTHYFQDIYLHLHVSSPLPSTRNKSELSRTEKAGLGTLCNNGFINFTLFYFALLLPF